MRLARVLIALIFLVAAMPPDGMTQPMRWCVQSIPPFFIQDGVFKGQGIMDRTLAKIFRDAPDLTSAAEDMPIARCLEEMRRRDDLCHISLVKTPEREGYAEFSIPMVRFLPHRLIVAEAHVDKFRPYLTPHGFDLEKFLRQPEGLQIVIIRGRSYGAMLDAMLEAHAASPALQFVPAATSPFLMILANRVEATIGHPVEAGYYARLQDREKASHDALQSFAIVKFSTTRTGDIRHETVAGHFSHLACSKGARGEAVVARANEMVRQGDVPRIMAEEYAQWLDANAREAFWDMQDLALRPGNATFNTPSAPPPSAPAR